MPVAKPGPTGLPRRRGRGNGTKLKVLRCGGCRGCSGALSPNTWGRFIYLFPANQASFLPEVRDTARLSLNRAKTQPWELKRSGIRKEKKRAAVAPSGGEEGRRSRRARPPEFRGPRPLPSPHGSAAVQLPAGHSGSADGDGPGAARGQQSSRTGSASARRRHRAGGTGRQPPVPSP